MLSRNLHALLMSSLLMTLSFQPLSAVNEEALEILPAEASSPFIQEQLKKAYQQLDEINAILQYIGQIVNKGVIKFPKTRSDKPAPTKAQALEWVFKTQKTIKDLKYVNELSNEQALLKINRTSKALIVHISVIMADNLKKFEEFEQPIILPLRVINPGTPEGLAEQHAIFEEQLLDNDRMIEALRSQSQTLGLTNVNLWARKIDAFNDKYRVTSFLEQVPRYAGIAGMALYLTPFRYLEGIPGISWAKRKIGTPNYYDPVGFRAIEHDEDLAAATTFLANARTPAAPIRTVVGFLNSDEYKGLKNLSGIAMMLFSKDIVGNALAPARVAFRNWWNRLKGFDVPDGSSIKYPEITLNDKRLVGLESQIEQMWEIVKYIIDPEKHDRAGSGLEKGILLTGPSRSGKTLTAQATCGTLNEELRKKGVTKKFAFKTVNANEFRWTPDSIKSIIQEAKLNAPCIVFIDELHLLPLQTKEGGDILNDFLTMTESLKSTDVGDAVIVLAATNRPELLDTALLKPGRFGIRVHFEEPDREKRKRYFRQMCEYYAIDTADIDIEALARQTEGCSFGDLDLVFKSASFTARKLGRSIVQQDFQDKIYKQFYRLRDDKELPLTAEARRRIAVHQAGHALMYVLFEKELNQHLEMVTIRGKWPKIIEDRVWFADPKNRPTQAKPVKWGHIKKSHASEVVKIETNPRLSAQVKLAGHIAEQILLGDINYGYHEGDKRKALNFLEKIALQGLKKEDFQQEELKEPMMKAKADLAACEREVHDILTAHRADLEKIAAELEAREILTGSDVKKLVTP